MKPTWRKPAGIFVMLTMITVLCVLVLVMAQWLAGLNLLLQLIIYTVLGIVWIAPLGPLLKWMETGDWR